VTFRREPSYFRAAPTDGPFRQVIICRETLSRRIVGFGLRAARRLYVNGEPREIGYLGSLRLLPEFRNIGLVARGYAFFRELHEDRRTPLYLTTIAEGNTKAIKVLTKGRAGLPSYHFAGLYRTAVFPMRQKAFGRPQWFNLQAGRREDLEEIVEFLNRVGPRRQFFPAYRPEDFFRLDGTLLGLAPQDIFLWRHPTSGCIGAMIAAWDQQSFKQTVVESYHGILRWLRPLANVAAWLRRSPRLPAPGEGLRYLTVALPAIVSDEAGVGHVFRAMLSTLEHGRRTSPHDYLVIGMHERDPCWPALSKLRPRCYTTRLYLVCWEDGEAFRATLDDRVPYLELGCL
jgi:hypothetical protein